MGRTPYADPFLISTLLSIQLPLFPRLKIDLASKFSIDIIHDLSAGVVDLAIAHEPPESPLLTSPRSRSNRSTSRWRNEKGWRHTRRYPSIRWMDGIGYSSSVNYIRQCMTRSSRRRHSEVFVLRAFSTSSPRKRHFRFIGRFRGCFRGEGWCVANSAQRGDRASPERVEPRLKTCLVCRADDDSKIASEFVRALMRKMPDRSRHQQMPLAYPA